MTKDALALFCYGLNMLVVNSVPFKNNYEIDLSKLDRKAFGSPKESSGDKLRNWKPSENMPNQDELGEYYQGDILFPIDDTRSGLINKSYRWPGKKVYYVISGNFSSADMDNINAAIDNYHANTCIEFVKRTDEYDYIKITSRSTGCWSSVGKIGGEQIVNLQNPGCVYTGIIEHEICHALGFFHEQSRIDRDSYIKVNYENIASGMEYNFDKVNPLITSTFDVFYDYGSIMHYSKYAFSSNNKPTIESVPLPVPFGQRKGLSEKDFKKINAMYNCY